MKGKEVKGMNTSKQIYTAIAILIVLIIVIGCLFVGLISTNSKVNDLLNAITQVKQTADGAYITGAEQGNAGTLLTFADGSQYMIVNDDSEVTPPLAHGRIK